MELWQKLVIIGWGILSLIGAIKGFKKCKYEKNTLGFPSIFVIYGAFVWADIVVFGIFWALVSVVLMTINTWILFPLVISIFWTVRSLGETIYWFNQQFSTIDWLVKRHTLKANTWFMQIFHDNYTAWFVFQICNQCVTVIALLFSLHFAKIWLTN